jgi:hypothetical protein
LKFPIYPIQSTVPSPVDPLCYTKNTQDNAVVPSSYTDLLYSGGGVEGGLVDWEMDGWSDGEEERLMDWEMNGWSDDETVVGTDS